MVEARGRVTYFFSSYLVQNYLLLFCQFTVVQGISHKEKIVAIKALVELNHKTENKRM